MDNKNLSFDSVPLIVTKVHEQLNDNSAILKQILERVAPLPNEWLTLEELREYLPSKPAKITIYKWVEKRKIPFHKKPRKLYFLKSEIDKWLKSGSKLTISEIKN